MSVLFPALVSGLLLDGVEFVLERQRRVFRRVGQRLARSLDSFE
jgi:hypothetical protein